MKGYVNRNGKIIRLNRRDMPANREDSPGMNKELRAQQFGVYRPLTGPSTRKLGLGAINALDSLSQQIELERGGKDKVAEFEVKESMATTFVHRNDIGRKRLEMIRAGFRLRYEMDNLHDGMPNKDDQEVLTVGLDIDRFEWTDRSERSLAVFFDTTSEGYDVLMQEREVLERIFGAYSLKLAEVVRRPTHVTLLRYGQSGDQLDLNRSHKGQIIDQIQQNFEDSRTFSVDLLSLRPGHTYDEPLELWTRTVDRAKSRLSSAS